MASYWVSGAAGSWGREIVAQLLASPATEKVVACCRGEARAAALLSQHQDPRLSIYLADIRDGQRVRQSMRGCSHVIHAAALKRVDTALYSPTEMSSVNIDGTKAVISAMVENGVARGFYISTDKAALPSTFYGATKFVAEQLWLSANGLWGVETCAARFGNALGSTGSVLEVWAACLREGKPLPLRFWGAATRYLITLPQAVRLLLSYLHDGKGGELFLPKMPAAFLHDLLVAFAGEKVDVRREEPLRGEKIHETLDGREWSDEAPILSVGEIRLLFDDAGIDYPAKEDL